MKYLSSIVARWLCVFTILGLVAAQPMPANAQVFGFGSGGGSDDLSAIPETFTKDQLNSLMSRLSDEAVRAALLEELGKRSVDTVDGAADNRVFLGHLTTGAWRQFWGSAAAFSKSMKHEARVLKVFWGDVVAAGGGLLIAGLLLLVLGASAAVERVVVRLFSSWRVRKMGQKWVPGQGPFKQIGQIFIKDLVGFAAFSCAAWILINNIFPQSFVGYAQAILLWLVLFPRAAFIANRAVLAPEHPERRIAYVSDEFANRFLFHQTALTVLIGVLLCNGHLARASGVILDTVPFAFWLNLAVHIYIIGFAWTFRAELTILMRGRRLGVSRYEEAAAQIYPYFAIFLSVVTWWVVNVVASYGNMALLASAPHYKTMFILLTAPLFDTLIRGVVGVLQKPLEGQGVVAERAHYAARRSYIRIGRLVAFTIVLLMVTGFWEISLVGLASVGVGARVAADLVQFFFICSIGYLIYEVVSLLINQKLAAEVTATGFDPEAQSGGGDGGGAGGSRLSTVLPLLLSTSRVAILVIFLLLALGNAGVNITPLLAGAGILGLAIGFGAQKLVTDVVSGVFFLIDDAFRISEYVEVEGTMGTVENISIRSLQLRHHKGPVHTIPYGEIPKITNYSRDWVIMKLRFTVPFDTDPNKVKKIFKKIGQDLLMLPEFKDDFLAPFKSQGVLEIDDIGMVIRGKFMCKPGTQFMIRKEIYNRVSSAFEASGIDFARREVRVALPSGVKEADLSEEDRAAVAAAASAAAPFDEPVEGAGKSDSR